MSQHQLALSLIAISLCDTCSKKTSDNDQLKKIAEVKTMYEAFSIELLEQGNAVLVF